MESLGRPVDRPHSEEFVAFPGRDPGMIIEKNAGPIVVWQGELHRVFLAVIQVLGSVEQFEGYKSTLGIHRFSLDGVAVDGPNWSWNKEGIYRVASNGLDRWEHCAARVSANFNAVYFPTVRGIGGIGTIGHGRPNCPYAEHQCGQGHPGRSGHVQISMSEVLSAQWRSVILQADSTDVSNAAPVAPWARKSFILYWKSVENTRGEIIPR